MRKIPYLRPFTLAARPIPGWLRPRLGSAALLLLTVGLFIYATNISDQMREWLFTDYSLTRDQFLIFYLAAAAVIGLVFVWEPQIKRELRESHALTAVTLAALLIAGLVSVVLIADQQYRLFRPVHLLSATLAYVIVLAGYAILLALDDASAAPTKRMIRWSMLLMIGIALAMLVLDVISVGRFLRLDDIFDEYMMVGNMTNYASNGRLSSTFLHEAYGAFDPSAPRWYLIGGLWLRLIGSQTLTALRSWSLLTGLIGLAITAVVLWRERRVTHWQRLMGFAFLLTSVIFTRTSHNMRMDIPLLVYGALILLLYLEAERTAKPALWLFAMGLAFYIGLEAHPFMAVMVGLSWGFVLIGQTLWSDRKGAWFRQRVIPYALGGILSVLLYTLVHFMPDIAANFNAMRDNQRIYVSIGSIAQEYLLNRLVIVFTFDLSLSPFDPFVLIGIVAASIAAKDHQIRWLGLFIISVILLVWIFLNSSLSYFAVLLPAMAYCFARLIRTRAALLIAAFVVLPFMAMLMGRDMTVATVQNMNEQHINELHLLDWRIPDGARVIASDDFWITLQGRTDFTSVLELRYVANRWGIEPYTINMLERMQPEIIICRPEIEPAFCDAADRYFNSEWTDFAITGMTYRVFMHGSE